MEGWVQVPFDVWPFWWTQGGLNTTSHFRLMKGEPDLQEFCTEMMPLHIVVVNFHCSTKIPVVNNLKGRIIYFSSSFQRCCFVAHGSVDVGSVSTESITVWEHLREATYLVAHTGAERKKYKKGPYTAPPQWLASYFPLYPQNDNIWWSSMHW